MSAQGRGLADELLDAVGEFSPVCVDHLTLNRDGVDVVMTLAGLRRLGLIELAAADGKGGPAVARITDEGRAA
ncbi:MAG: hypothetical protein AABM42_03095 [Actinomycetota bacterium]